MRRRLFFEPGHGLKVVWPVLAGLVAAVGVHVLNIAKQAQSEP